MKNRRKNSFGFTLAEVVVTIAIVGAALMYFMYITLENNDRSREAYKMRFYKTLAREKMEEFLLARTSDDETIRTSVSKTGEFERAPGYYWEIEDNLPPPIEVPFQDETEAAQDTTDKTYKRYIVSVQLKIFFKDASGVEPLYTLNTMFQEKVDNEN